MCISVECGPVGLQGNGYAEIESNFWFSQKGFNGIRDITSWGSGLYQECLQRLKFSDQKIE